MASQTATRFELQNQSEREEQTDHPSVLIETNGPYIGVSGVATPEHQVAIEMIAGEHDIAGTDRFVALGI